MAIDHFGLINVLDMALLEVASRWLPASLSIEKELVQALVQQGHEVHITKNHHWGGESPYLLSKNPNVRGWTSEFHIQRVDGASKVAAIQNKSRCVFRKNSKNV